MASRASAGCWITSAQKTFQHGFFAGTEESDLHELLPESYIRILERLFRAENRETQCAFFKVVTMLPSPELSQSLSAETAPQLNKKDCNPNSLGDGSLFSL